MARTAYGLSGGDIIAQISSDGDFEPSTAVFDVMSVRTGGSPVTDLLAMTSTGAEGGAITTVTPDGVGRVEFFGVDGYNGTYWLRNQADTTANRYRVDPVDVADRVKTIEASGTGAVLSTLADAKGDLIVATAADTFARKAIGAEGTVPVSRAAETTGIAWESVTVDVSGKADKSGSVNQFADIDDTARADGDVYMEDSGTMVPTNIATTLGAVDQTTGELLYSAFAPFMILGFIKNEGDPDPAGLPLGEGIPIIGWQRPAAASIIPVYDDEAIAIAASSLVLVTTQSYAVDDDLMLVVGMSGEAGTAGAPAEATFTFATGAAAQTLRIRGFQSGTAGCAHYQGKCTTTIPVGTNVTVTFKGTDGTTTQNRAMAAAHLVKMPNLSATPFDQSVGVNAAASGTLNLSLGPTGATTQAVELAMMSIFMAGGGPPAIRSIAGTNGWGLIKGTEAAAGGATRILYTFYKLLAATGAVTGTVTVTSSDSQTGGWGGCVSTWKSV